MALVIALCCGILVASIGFLFHPQIRNLGEMLSPYDSVARVRIEGNSKSIRPKNRNMFLEIIRPIKEMLVNMVSNLLSITDDSATELRLQHAGIKESIESFRVKTLKKVFIFLGIGLLIGAGIGTTSSLIFFPTVFIVVALSKSRSKIDNAIELRKQQIKYELYSINQMLSIHIRTGAGIYQALDEISKRTTGLVSRECKAVINRTKTGMTLEEALSISAKLSPEPYFARTLKLLSASSSRGADLTQGLLDLAHDLRRSLREDVRANSTKKRAAMLVPTIGILAPIMLLFVAAPIPSIVLGTN